MMDCLDVYMPGQSFPKGEDPIGEIESKRWPVQIVQKPGCLLKAEDLLPGHRRITDAIVRLWSKDIENGLFVIERKVIDQDTSLTKKRKNKTSNSTQKRSRYDKSSSGISSKPSESRRRLLALAKGNKKKSNHEKKNKKKKSNQKQRSLQDDESETEESETEELEKEKSESEELDMEESDTDI